MNWLSHRHPKRQELRELADLLQLVERLEVVDVGANPIDGDPPYLSLLESGFANVTGFEPQAAALERLTQSAGPNERYLPHVIADGRSHTLHLCASDGFTSLLPPDPEQLALLTDFPRLAEVTRTETVQTVRLDDVPDLRRIDLLKMDVQGGELAVIEGGGGLLGEAAAVQTEVGFHRLYAGGPTFADIDLALRSHGFAPHNFVSTRTWPMAPVEWADAMQATSRQLVEADLLYVLDPARLDLIASPRLKRLAFIAHGGYSAAGVALRCLLELTSRGELPGNTIQAYRVLLLDHRDSD